MIFSIKRMNSEKQKIQRSNTSPWIVITCEGYMMYVKHFRTLLIAIVWRIASRLSIILVQLRFLFLWVTGAAIVVTVFRRRVYIGRTERVWITLSISRWEMNTLTSFLEFLRSQLIWTTHMYEWALFMMRVQSWRGSGKIFHFHTLSLSGTCFMNYCLFNREDGKRSYRMDLIVFGPMPSLS